ncbi:MAG: serine/threonine protein kinase [Deltaproteobacteria bacterium]|nr:serine/threonine protein kinase [Deltaproteobacteria bacterium]
MKRTRDRSSRNRDLHAGKGAGATSGSGETRRRAAGGASRAKRGLSDSADTGARPLDLHSRATASTVRAKSPHTRRPGGTDTARATLIFAAAGRQDADPPVPAGTTFARKYFLKHLLGQGAMGAVYLAHDLLLEREVAVKILLPVHAADPELVDSFQNEAVAMASVRHINVVQIYTSGQCDGLLFFVMEYMPGHSVAALIRELFGCGESLALDTVVNIVDQVSLGLAAMHERGIFHGDVKPANMLMDENSHVAIADFGLVGSSKTPTHSAHAEHPRLVSGGTPLYIAPELIGGRAIPPEERHLCDVYSLGVSVFEMFTGQGPFQGRTIKKILKGHLVAPPPKLTKLRPDLPSAINPVIRRALAKQPRKRYPSCEELAFAVSRAVQDRAA